MFKKDSTALTVLTLGALVAVGAFLRVVRISGESAWYDEVVTLQALDARSLVEFLRRERAPDQVMTPVYFTLAYLWSRLVSPGDVAMRMLSVLIGLATIPAMYVVSRRFYGRGPSLVAAGALCFSIIHIYHSQEIRVYGLVILLALVSMYGLLRGLEAGTGAWWNKWRWWALYALANLLLTFTQFLTVFLFPLQFLYLLLFHRQRSLLLAWISLHGTIALLLGLWLLPVFKIVGNLATWISMPTWEQLGLFLRIYSGGCMWGGPGTLVAQWTVAGCVFLLVLWHLAGRFTGGTRAAAEDENPARGRHGAVLLALWLFLPVIQLALGSIIKPIFVYRYALVSILPLYILLGGAVCAVAGNRLLLAVRVAVVLVLVCAWGYQLSRIPVQPLRPDWAAAGEYLEQHARANDVILLPMTCKATLRHHSPGLREQMRGPLSLNEIVTNAKAVHKEHRDAWTVMGLAAPLEFEAACRDQGLRYERIEFPGCPKLPVYHLPCRF